MTESLANVKFIRDPVELSCPCGLPLTLSFTSEGRWVLGHLEKMCSPLIYLPAKLPNNCQTHQESIESDVQAIGTILLKFMQLKRNGEFKVPIPDSHK